MNNVSFKKVDPKVIQEIINTYQTYEINNTDPNKVNVFNKSGITISIYKTNSVLFQGYQADKEAAKFFTIPITPIIPASQTTSYFEKDVIGNDEVGVGDVFGPLVVTATYLPPTSFQQLVTLPIKDSKKMTTEQIMTLAPIIQKLVQSVTVVIDNNQYNQWYTQYQNAHVIKALAHNQALVQLLSIYQLTNKTIFIDQFVNATKYFEYLQKITPVVKDNVVFITKGEEKSLAIACSAILSRATFLTTIKNLETKYHLKLPLGASENVKALAQKYKATRPLREYQHFLKIHFNLKAK
ncbi:MAG: ribonuclease HIII [Spiroplasma poulsonii]|uniref:Ribonuclease n=1 Tax=Spiroplasma poulsonii TaxID=2138 RepID=A0A2P6FCC8_9MOLU|nr:MULTISPECIES: ribonuclease HIII [Spiroplasma]KAF0851525.1 Ribonuclease HIII [Spiroplasma poulsonii]MBH8622706.1 ribonuclease HIII [Spiroplasma sp. hyd1]MBW1241588.1 ribonuclease HIII [Spiroplasma poulsonii]MBW3058448.1 ribonuclease HIII [Spiroplasma poulsonii]PQM31119.1 Ribonuclease HIII [Spiroplasma poulsonii]